MVNISNKFANNEIKYYYYSIKKLRGKNMNTYEEILNLQKKYLENKKTISVDERIENLKKLKSLIKKYEKDIIYALELDLGKHVLNLIQMKLDLFIVA